MKTINNIIFLFLIFTTTSLVAQVAPVDEKGIAIGGYDVVAYFSNQAIKGQSQFQSKHENAIYYFSTAANQEAFSKNPTKYLPQYDGYCAWGVGAKATKFPINPETFKVVDGKLYLFFNGPFNGSPFNTLTVWNTDEQNLLKAANANWPKVKSGK